MTMKAFDYIKDNIPSFLGGRVKVSPFAFGGIFKHPVMFCFSNCIPEVFPLLVAGHSGHLVLHSTPSLRL
jgi:hypothetical protein